MFSRQWEDFQDIITSYVPTVDDHGPLAGPIRRFKIWRDGDLQLCMDTEGPESVGGPETHYPPGTVRINEDRVTFRSDMGLELEAIGVSAAHTNTHIEGSAPGITTQKVDIHRLVGKFAPPQKPRYAIDWLENVPTVFLWPDNIERNTEKATTVTLGGMPPHAS